MSAPAPALPDGRLPASRARALVSGAAIALGIGLAAAAAAFLSDARRFTFAYLVGFLVAMSTGVGALALLLLQHLTRAGWSAAARRFLEWLSAVLIPGILLFLPVAAGASALYGWLGPEAEHDELIHQKLAYLNRPAFLARGFAFVAAWGALAWVFGRISRRQDDSPRAAVQTAWLQKWSAPAIIVVGLSATFAAFDWIMSLDARWYSTIFGIYFIAGSLVSALAVLSLGTIWLERQGLYGPVSTVEHRHDIGKLLFGFTCFWAYIAFCQFFLIWYAGIPEETIFYHRRWVGSWRTVSLLLAIGHFALPFVVLIGRTAKRSVVALGGCAALLLVMHIVDLYWLVMPTLDPSGARPGWIDLAGLGVPLAAIALALALGAARAPIYPLRDPRLPEAIRLENL